MTQTPILRVLSAATLAILLGAFLGATAHALTREGPPRTNQKWGSTLLFQQGSRPLTQQEKGINQITCPPPARPTCGSAR